MKLFIFILILMMMGTLIYSCREDTLAPEELENISVNTTGCIQIKWEPDVYRCTDGDSVWYVRDLGKASADIIIYVTKDGETFGGVSVIVWHRGEVVYNERADINGRIYIYQDMEGLITVQGAIGPLYGEISIYKELNKNVFIELQMGPHG